MTEGRRQPKRGGPNISRPARRVCAVQAFDGMATETTEHGPTQPPQQAAEPTPPEPEPGQKEPGRRHGAIAFARRHPALTLIGVAGVGLFGGVELAAGVLIGGGVAVALRKRAREPTEHEASEAGEHARDQGRAPHELRQRVRAVAQAARGKLAPADQSTSPSASPG
jgi:hypothetical protein